MKRVEQFIDNDSHDIQPLTRLRSTPSTKLQPLPRQNAVGISIGEPLRNLHLKKNIQMWFPSKSLV